MWRMTLCGLGLAAGLLGATPAWAGIVEDLESPVADSEARWILLGGTGLTLAVLATQDSVEGPFEKTTVAQKPLGSYSKYGDLMGQVVPNAVYAGGMLTASYFGNALGYERAFAMFEATAYASLITEVLKYTVREPRPYDSSVRNSFPSGHATTAFAFAGIVAAEHGWYYGAPAMLLAAFVGYSRINDDQHHVHDVVAGATVGLSCAYGIYNSHKPESEKSAMHIQVVPTPIPGGMELAALLRY